MFKPNVDIQDFWSFYLFAHFSTFSKKRKENMIQTRVPTPDCICPQLHIQSQFRPSDAIIWDKTLIWYTIRLFTILRYVCFRLPSCCCVLTTSYRESRSSLMPTLPPADRHRRHQRGPNPENRLRPLALPPGTTAELVYLCNSLSGWVLEARLVVYLLERLWTMMEQSQIGNYVLFI